MKKIFIILTVVLFSASVYSQVPQNLSYQAVIRNNNNDLVKSSAVGIRISILKGSESGNLVYSESQTTTTNINGLISIILGDNFGFDTINWSIGPYFIKSETDPDGGTNYTITGTSQLLSVPYALHAKTAESITGGIAETDPFFNKSVAKNIKASDTTRWGNINEVKITAGKNVTVSGSGTTVVPYVISAGISGSRLKVPTHTAMGTTGPWDTCRNSCVRLGSGWHIPTFEEETYIASGAIGIPTGGWATTTNSVWTSSQWDTRVGTAPSANGWVVMNESGSWGAYGWGTVSVGCRCVIDSDTARVYPTQTAMGPTGSFETCRNSCVALGNGWHIPTFEDETYITSGVIGLPTGGWSTNGVWTSTPWDSRVTNAPGAGVWVVMSETGTWTGLGELTVSVGCRCVR